jgi:hypothetical protein
MTGGQSRRNQTRNRIIKTSPKTRDNLTKTERTAFRTLKNYTHLTILPADKGNATVILNTSDYKRKITALLDDTAYKKTKQRPHRFHRTQNHTTVEKILTSRGRVQATTTIQLQITVCQRYTKKGSL